MDGAAPFVVAYRTRDGGFIFVSPLEPKFFALMLDTMGIDDIDTGRQYDETYWPFIRQRLGETFADRSRDEWASILEPVDACCTPVLDPWELNGHPHVQSRKLLVEVDGLEQPAPAPRFSRTVSEVRHGPGGLESARDILNRWGVEKP